MGYPVRRRLGPALVVRTLLLFGLLAGTALYHGKITGHGSGGQEPHRHRRLLAVTDYTPDDVTNVTWSEPAAQTTETPGGASTDSGQATSEAPGEKEVCTEPAYHEFPQDAFSNQQRRDGAIILHILMVVYMFIALAIVCDTYFVASLEKICEKLHLGEDVAGATFMAAGSSAPELFTSIIGVFVAKGDVGVGTIVGSAVFNILFVIGLCGILVTQVVHLTWYPLLRDSAFYSMSVVILISSIADSAVTWYEALILLLLYVLYIVIMKFNTGLQTLALQKIHFFGEPSEDTNVILSPNVKPTYYGNYERFDNEKGEKGPARPPLPPPMKAKQTIEMMPVIPVDEYVLRSKKKLSFEDACFRFMKSRRFRCKTRFRSAVYIIMLERRKLCQDPAFRRHLKKMTTANNYDGEVAAVTQGLNGTLEVDPDPEAWKTLPRMDEGLMKIVSWFITLPICAILYYTIPDCRVQRWDRWFMATFGLTIVWIAFFSYIMVWMVALIGYTLGIPDSIMGITFLAAGTSVPDAMASVMVARQGQGDMAVSNTIGSNVFDICIGLALPWFVQTAMVAPGSYVHINSNGMVFSVILLFLTVIITICGIHFGGWRLNKKVGFICLTSYAVFLTLAIMIEFNVFGYVNPPMCTEY